MAKIPGQRRSGSFGGSGGQLSNRGMSYSRGGRPSASRGGGGGRKGGCVVLVVALSASALTAAYAGWQLLG